MPEPTGVEPQFVGYCPLIFISCVPMVLGALCCILYEAFMAGVFLGRELISWAGEKEKS